jgi:hypothetical protein
MMKHRLHVRIAGKIMNMTLGPKVWSSIGSNRDARKWSMTWTTTGAMKLSLIWSILR